MNEFRRFLRFTLPGMACVTELAAILAISDYPEMRAVFQSVKTESAVGLALGVFLGSGALGFILANLYFALYWSWPFCNWITINHHSFLNSVKDRLQLLDAQGNKLDLGPMSQRDAWTIISQYWGTHIEADEQLKGINDFCNRLVDITHGIGASLVGTTFAFLVWAGVHFLHLRSSDSGPAFGVVIPVMLWILLFYAYGVDFIRTVRAHQRVVNSTVLASLEAQVRGGEAKVLIRYTK